MWDFLDVLQIIYSWGVVNDANCDFVHVADTGEEREEMRSVLLSADMIIE